MFNVFIFSYFYPINMSSFHKFITIILPYFSFRRCNLLCFINDHPWEIGFHPIYYGWFVFYLIVDFICLKQFLLVFDWFVFVSIPYYCWFFVSEIFCGANFNLKIAFILYFCVPWVQYFVSWRSTYCKGI